MLAHIVESAVLVPECVRYCGLWLLEHVFVFCPGALSWMVFEAHIIQLFCIACRVEENSFLPRDVPHTGQAPGMVTKSGAHGQHDKATQSCAHKQTTDSLFTLAPTCHPPEGTAAPPTLEQSFTCNEPASNPGSLPAADTLRSSKLPNSSPIARQSPQNDLEGVKESAVEQEAGNVLVASKPGMFLDTRVETKEERRARLRREKNKRNQQAFRERCRVRICHNLSFA